MDPADTTIALKKRAGELGFSLCGVCPAVSPPGAERLDQWLAAGFAGEMQYLQGRRDAYRDPNRVLDGVRSIVMLAMNYRTADPIAPQAGKGRVSRYAWSDVDYHDLIRPRLNTLADFLVERIPDAIARGVVDTAPLLEREFAALAGLGWIGKNTLLLNRQHGSWFFLAALLTDVELIYDTHRETDHCGTCRACLDACPTGAFPQPYVLDASRCISYLTIELRDTIPHELRSGVQDWAFGCDVCQEVCPWNSRSPQSHEIAFDPRADSNPIDLIALFELDDAAFRGTISRHTLMATKATRPASQCGDRARKPTDRKRHSSPYSRFKRRRFVNPRRKLHGHWGGTRCRQRAKRWSCVLPLKPMQAFNAKLNCALQSLIDRLPEHNAQLTS